MKVHNLTRHVWVRDSPVDAVHRILLLLNFITLLVVYYLDVAFGTSAPPVIYDWQLITCLAKHSHNHRNQRTESD